MNDNNSTQTLTAAPACEPPAEPAACERADVQLLPIVARSERGMTLVEIMIVLTIMASIMGIVGFFARGAMINAQIKEATTEVANLGQMVTQFYVFTSEYPDSLDQLMNPPSGMAPIVESIPMDPWGNDYQYSKDGSDFELFSMGPDGSSGGGDDICPGGGECN